MELCPWSRQMHEPKRQQQQQQAKAICRRFGAILPNPRQKKNASTTHGTKKHGLHVNLMIPWNRGVGRYVTFTDYVAPFFPASELAAAGPAASDTQCVCFGSTVTAGSLRVAACVVVAGLCASGFFRGSSGKHLQGVPAFLGHARQDARKDENPSPCSS